MGWKIKEREREREEEEREEACLQEIVHDSK